MCGVMHRGRRTEMIEVNIFMSESGEVIVGKVFELEDTLLKLICSEDSIKLVADAST